MTAVITREKEKRMLRKKDAKARKEQILRDSIEDQAAALGFLRKRLPAIIYDTCAEMTTIGEVWSYTISHYDSVSMTNVGYYLQQLVNTVRPL